MQTVESRAVTTLDRIAGTITMSCVRFMAWFLKKLWRRLYHALHVDERGLQRVCLLFILTLNLILHFLTRYVRQSRRHLWCWFLPTVLTWTSSFCPMCSLPTVYPCPELQLERISCLCSLCGMNCNSSHEIIMINFIILVGFSRTVVHFSFAGLSMVMHCTGLYLLNMLSNWS